MHVEAAAQRWAQTWASAWPRKDIDAIVQLHSDSGDHWASMFRPYRGRDGLRNYVEESFADETQPAETWFAEPIVNGASASIEYWVIIYIDGRPTTISGCTVLHFDESGLVSQARDYSHAKDGYHQRPIEAFSAEELLGTG